MQNFKPKISRTNKYCFERNLENPCDAIDNIKIILLEEEVSLSFWHASVQDDDVHKL